MEIHEYNQQQQNCLINGDARLPESRDFSNSDNDVDDVDDMEEIETQRRKNSILSLDQMVIDKKKFLTHQHHRTLFSRLFGKIEKGSLRGSAFALVSVALGSGILGIPKTFEKMSILFGSLFLIFAGINVLMNFYFLAIVSNIYKISDYSNLLSKALGSYYSKALDYCSLLYLFGALISYHVLLYRMICTFVFDFFYTGDMTLEQYLENGDLMSSVYKWTISFYITIFILYPMCLFKNLSTFRFISIVGIASIFYIIIVSNLRMSILIHIFIIYYLLFTISITGYHNSIIFLYQP